MWKIGYQEHEINQEASSGYIHIFKNNFSFFLWMIIYPFFLMREIDQGVGKISEILVMVCQSTLSAQRNLTGKGTEKVEQVYIIDDFESQK